HPRPSRSAGDVLAVADPGPARRAGRGPDRDGPHGGRLRARFAARPARRRHARNLPAAAVERREGLEVQRLRPDMSRRKAPRVSVLTPVYNGDETISECIESVLSQSEGDFEYLIQDNSSTDRTREITEGYARKDPRIRLVRNASLVSAMENHQLLF